MGSWVSTPYRTSSALGGISAPSVPPTAADAAETAAVLAPLLGTDADVLADAFRQVAAAKQRGELDNTVVLIMSDNGASAEGGPSGSFNEYYFFNRVPESLEENLRRIDDLGGPRAHNHYPWGWAWAGNTPFQR